MADTSKKAVKIVLVWLCVFFPGCGKSVLEDIDGAVDAGADARQPPDAKPDRGWLPWPDAAVDAAPVDAYIPNPNVVELPPDGTNIVSPPNNRGYFVTYSEARNEPEQPKVYYFDLLTLTEHQVIDGGGPQGSSYVYKDQIMYGDGRGSDIPNGIYHVAYYLYDIKDATEMWVMDTTNRGGGMQFNDNYMLFLTDQYSPDCDWTGLVLKNRHTMEDVILAECSQIPHTHFSLSEHYAAWVAWSPDYEGQYVYIRDLAGEYTFRIESTGATYSVFPSVDGERVVWQDSRDGRREIYMYTFSTGEEVCLTPDPWEQAWPRLRNGIVSWSDYRHSQEWGDRGDCDIYVHEIATSLSRRVTDRSERWKPFFVDSGWIVYVLYFGHSRAKIYAHDLVGDGILTPDGYMIP